MQGRLSQRLRGLSKRSDPHLPALKRFDRDVHFGEGRTILSIEALKGTADLTQEISCVTQTFALLAELSFARHAYELMLVTELTGTLVDVDVPGSPPVRVSADVILGVLGLSEERLPTDALALLLIAGVLLLCTIRMCIACTTCGEELMT